MTREEKIEAIYKEMANKKRTFGCRCKTHNWANIIFIRKNRVWVYLYMKRNKEFTIPLWYSPIVIWHPVMIGDVISYLRKPFDKFIELQPVGEHWLVDFYFKNMKDLLIKWWDTRLSIDKQDDECIDFVYSLIKKS